MKQQLEGRQSTANAEVESLKSQLQQMIVTMETQQQRYICMHMPTMVAERYMLPGHTDEK